MREAVVIVTGASSGIGWETALAAARGGYRVVVTARRAERLQELVQQIEAAGGTALAVPGDVTQAADQQLLIDSALQRFGRVDVLINNAGVPLSTSFASASLDDVQRQWQTNVNSVVEISKRALPHLAPTRGTIINVGSIAGRFSLPGWGLYYATKVAVASISDALRRELQEQGVKVCLVEPGPIATEFGERAGFAPGSYLGLPAQSVANTIVRLIEHPRRRVMVPRWLWLPILLGSGLVRALPDVIDLLYLLVGKVRQRSDIATPSSSDRTT